MTPAPPGPASLPAGSPSNDDYDSGYDDYDPTCTVTVCRTCASDGAGEHGPAARLCRDLAGTARVRGTDCLDACDYAQVVVVQPSRAQRRAGDRPAWLGFVTDAALDDITAWVRAGGPGVAEPPGSLHLHRINAPGRP